MNEISHDFICEFIFTNLAEFWPYFSNILHRTKFMNYYEFRHDFIMILVKFNLFKGVDS